MKILLINECHWRAGGADVVYLNETNLLLKEGFEVMSFAPLSSQVEDTPYKKFFYKKSNNVLNQLLDSFYNIKAERALNKLLKVEKPDIVHLHCFLGFESSSIYHVIKRYNIPIVHTVHDYRLICPTNHFLDNKGKSCEKCKEGNFIQCVKTKCAKGSVLRSLVMYSAMIFRNTFFNPINNIDGFIFVSLFSQNKHFEHNVGFTEVPSIVLYNSTKRYIKHVGTHHMDYCLYLGRLSEEKGISILIDSFINLKDIKLLVAGSGPLSKSLDARIIQSGVRNIDLLGYKDTSELNILIENAKFVIVPSVCYENNPMAIVEAFSFGKPVLGSNSGAIPEFIIPGFNGFLFEKNNIKSLADCVRDAFRIEESFYCELCDNAFHFFEENFSEEVHISKLTSFYQEIINKRKASNNLTRA